LESFRRNLENVISSAEDDFKSLKHTKIENNTPFLFAEEWNVMTCLQLAKRCYLKTEDFVYEPLSYYAEFWTGTNKDEKAAWEMFDVVQYMLEYCVKNGGLIRPHDYFKDYYVPNDLQGKASEKTQSLLIKVEKISNIVPFLNANNEYVTNITVRIVIFFYTERNDEYEYEDY
jgi:hypothetical protein